jgi:hypothetical protein
MNMGLLSEREQILQRNKLILRMPVRIGYHAAMHGNEMSGPAFYHAEKNIGTRRYLEIWLSAINEYQ